MRKVDQLMLMVKGIEIIEAKGDRKLTKALNRFNSFVVQQIGRGLYPEERIKILEVFRSLHVSDAGTTNREDAIRNLFQMNFLTDKSGIRLTNEIEIFDHAMGMDIPIPMDAFMASVFQFTKK